LSGAKAMVTSWFDLDVFIVATKVTYSLGKCGPAETRASYTCDRLTFVSGCVVEATNDNQNCGANHEMPHKMQSMGGVRDKYNPRLLNYFAL
jgi:hypothetical protein